MRSITLLVCLCLIACGGSDAKKDKDDDSATDAGAGSYPDALSSSPALDVPGPASSMADAVLADTDFAATLAATMDVLAEGGISTAFADTVTRQGKAPASSLTAWPTGAISMAVEASERRSTYTFTLTELALQLADYGFPYPDGARPTDFWLTALADWYAAAEADVDAPDSFAVLFIAAMNQKQDPRANIASGVENPDLIRFSLLELELLVAAFERVSTIPSGPALTLRSASPCSDLIKQTGLLGQAGGIAGAEITGKVIEAGFEQLLGAGEASNASNTMSALGILSKLNKLAEQFRHGGIKLEVDGANPVAKPLRTEPNKQGSLTATVGVDAEKLSEVEAAKGGAQASEQQQQAQDCLGSLGIPTPADIRDVANDAENWRVSWSIIAGGGSQVVWSPGQTWDINLRTEKKVTRASDSTAESKVSFDIFPQTSRADVGNLRTRKAVFKVQLRRGSVPQAGTAWGAGKAGFAAAAANPIAAALGLTDASVDILGGWLLEAFSPSAQATQLLTEVEPTGLVGTISWTIEGRFEQHEPGVGQSFTDTQARVLQTGLSEILSRKGKSTTEYGTAHCVQSYTYKAQMEETPEGGEVVGTGIDQSAIVFSGDWTAPQSSSRVSSAELIDWDLRIGNTPDSQLTPDMLAKRGLIEISVRPTCPEYRTKKQYLVRDDELVSNVWQTTYDYVEEDLQLYPFNLEHVIQLENTTNQQTIEGNWSDTSTVTLAGVTIPVKRSIKWKLYRIPE